MNYLSFCCIAKDETLFIKEWVDYHTIIGGENFIIFDNESKIPIRETLREYISEGFVTVIDVIGKEQQLPVYTYCIQNWQKKIQMDCLFRCGRVPCTENHR